MKKRLLNASQIESAFTGTFVSGETNPTDGMQEISPVILVDESTEESLVNQKSGIKKCYLFVSVFTILLGTAQFGY